MTIHVVASRTWGDLFRSAESAKARIAARFGLDPGEVRLEGDGRFNQAWGAAWRNVGLLLSVLALVGVILAIWVGTCKTNPFNHKFSARGLTAYSVFASLAAAVCFQCAVDKLTRIAYYVSEESPKRKTAFRAFLSSVIQPCCWIKTLSRRAT